MSNLSKSILLAIIYTLLFNVLLFFNKNTQQVGIYLRLIEDMAILLPTSMVTFYLILLNTRLIRGIFLNLLFALGVINNYFYYNFNKIFDTGVLIDLLTVESSLIQDFVSINLVIFILVTSLLGFLYIFKVASRKSRSYYIDFISIIILIIIVCISSSWNKRIFVSTIVNYLPFNIINSIHEYYYQFKPHIYKLEDKNDLTKQYSFIASRDNDKPMTIILVIGESMRGDLISLNSYDAHDNMPRLKTNSELISFLNAKASTTATRTSLPYMLTSAIVPNFHQALSEKSIISIFKHLGFTTSWIGNQGIFGIHETTFASNVMEADYYLINKDLQKAIPNRSIYDIDMLPFISKRLKQVTGDHFMVIHMLGSHWNFYKRYPEDLQNKFTPECFAKVISQCDKESLFNTYANTIKQSDDFLDGVLSLVENNNSFMLYSSDHGFSIGENGYYGNAYSQDDNIPSEQLNIAMFFWGSKTFYNENKGLFAQIYTKKNKKINHDYIFHSLLDCAKVKSSYINKDLSLCK